MACHKKGVIPFKDTIREHSALYGESERHVQKLYLPVEQMDFLIKGDQKIYVNAQTAAMKPMLGEWDAEVSEILEDLDPVGHLARLYLRGHLDLKRVACELNLEEPQEVVHRLGNRKMKELGLEQLQSPGGIISRDDWEAVEVHSLMQRAATELKYSPVRGLR